jgi:hypothetical protein
MVQAHCTLHHSCPVQTSIQTHLSWLMDHGCQAKGVIGWHSALFCLSNMFYHHAPLPTAEQYQGNRDLASLRHIHP